MRESIDKRWYFCATNHALRLYFRHPETELDAMSVSDALLWQSCDTVLAAYSERDREILCKVYNYRDMPMSKAVERTALDMHIDRIRIWTLVNRVSIAIAKKGRLI